MKRVMQLILIIGIAISCSPKQELAKDDGSSGGSGSGGGTGGGVDTAMYTVTVNGDFNRGKVYLNGDICNDSCSVTFEAGTNVMVVAMPDEGQVFESITGATCGNKQYCPITVSKDLNLTVSFSASPVKTFELSYTKSGNGNIFIDGGNCEPNCTRNLPEGTEVTLSATPLVNHEFTGFTGDCTGKAVCRLTMTKNMSVTASFSAIAVPVYHNLSFTSGAGGTIAVNSISCGSDCSNDYLENTQLVLTATPDSGYTFDGFSGACTGTDPCNVTMDAAKMVGATFSQIAKPTYYNLSFTSNIPGGLFINGSLCTINCSAQHLSGTNLTLTATPPNGYLFDSFGGDCSGSSCAVVMDSDRTVTVNFVAAPTSVNRGLAWDSTTDASGYKIYFGRSTGNYNGDCLTGNQTSPVDIPVGSLADSNNPEINLEFKQTGAACYLSITAYNAVGESPTSSEITFTP